MKRAILAGILVMGSISCARQPTPAPAPKAAAETPSAAPLPGEGTIAEVRLVPQREGAAFRWRAEMLGLATASLEAGLADLEDVIPVVEGVRPSPGLAGALRSHRAIWAGAVQVEPSADGVRFLLSLCDPAGSCTDLAAEAPRERPEAALAHLLASSARLLGRVPAEEVTASWAAPLSADPYAILLAGRSAATFYGLLSGVGENQVGDKQRDVITRALLVDPRLSLNQWINARRSLQRGMPQLARAAFARASVAQPQRVLHRADEAAALGAMGLEDEARRAWDLVQAKAPDELRFIVARAGAMVAAGELDDAAALLEDLPERFDADLAAIGVLVAIAEAGGPAPPYDGLLARWQLADTADPEPVRRRIGVRVREGRYDEALSFLQTLEARGAKHEAQRLAISLGIATGDHALAAAMAEELQLPQLATRIRARAALTANPAVVPPELQQANEPVEYLVRGGARLLAGTPAAALADADAALARAPWMPEALALRMQSLRDLGRASDAARAEARLRSADPAWPVDAKAPDAPPALQAQSD